MIRSLIYSLIIPCLSLSACSSPNHRRGDVPGYAENAFAAYPGTAVRYYDVHGTTGDTIRASLNSIGPTDITGKHNDAITYWEPRWHWDATPDGGGCDLAHLNFTFAITVTLPRLDADDRDHISPQVLEKWGEYMAALIEHETGHVKHAYEHSQDIANAIRSSSCDGADAAGKAQVRELMKFDTDYDSETRHGETQGVMFP